MSDFRITFKVTFWGDNLPDGKGVNLLRILSNGTNIVAIGAGDGIRTRDTLLGRQELFR